MPAATLGLSAATVRTRLKRCFGKTGIRSQVVLARFVYAFMGDGDASISNPGH